jgi:DNA-binding transcriptional ArsR family regulator
MLGDVNSERKTGVLDERALQALSNPLRVRLLRILRAEGPATASGLAKRVGESSGLTSYHLRHLADAGLVQEDVGRGTRRERWWRSVHEVSHWSPAEFVGNPEARRASVAMRREVYRWQSRLLEQWLAEEADWDKTWVDAAGPSDDLLVMTPDQLQSMSQEIRAVVQRYRAQPPPDGTTNAERVIWLQHTVPVRGELPL